MANRKADNAAGGEAPIKPLPGQLEMFPTRRKKREPKPIKIREEEFQQQVIDMAHLYGWKIAHFRPGMNRRGQWQTAVSGDGAGFPDNFLVRRATRHSLVAELKIPPNPLTEKQNEWLDDCEICGIPAYVWTPDDWAEIESVLKYGPT